MNRNRSSIKNHRRIAKLAQFFCQLCLSIFFLFHSIQIQVRLIGYYKSKMTLFQIHISIIVNSLLCFTYSISCSEKKILKPDSQMLYDVACNFVPTTPATMTVPNNIGLHDSHGFGRRIVLHGQQLFSDKILSCPALWWGHIGIASTRQ